MSTKVLLVEDEMTLGSTVSERLNHEGFDSVWVQNKKEALDQISKNSFELALLDVQLPDGLGFEIAEFGRKQQPSMAIVFLTAMGGAEDRIRGLETGAEDYIVKPFHFKELLLRIQNALRRSKFVSKNASNERVKIGEAQIDFSAFSAARDAQNYVLTHKECALLQLLYERKGQVVSRDEILNLIWSESEFPTPRTIDNFILKLRKLIEIDPALPKFILSIRGVGYQLVL